MRKGFEAWIGEVTLSPFFGQDRGLDKVII